MDAYRTDNHLPRTLTWKGAFSFPLSSPNARKEILIGGLLFMALPPFGWIVNLGNRLNAIRRLYHGEPPFQVFSPFQDVFMRGCISAGTIFSYLSSGLSVIVVASLFWQFSIFTLPVQIAIACVGLLLFGLGMFVLPGCMVIYACEDDPTVLLDPLRAARRGIARGGIYLKAWAIALTAIGISLLGFLVFGVGFFFLSVWAWQVAGYAFSLGIYSNVESSRSRWHTSP